MRLFISINLPVNIKEGLSGKISSLKEELYRDIRWVKEENWHLTLKFLGEIREEEVNLIKEKIFLVARNYRQQSIRFSRIAAFPTIANPRVVYVGINDQNDILQQLYRDLEYQFSEKPALYTPHLTIGRVKAGVDKRKVSAVLKKYQEIDFSDFKIKVANISLMESILRKEGPIYKELYSANLMENTD